ncbi:hypothetical protein CF165_38560 [Amycolatopsis vastitatis]|uniref:GIY-YIG nuclease family protein n=2 Tax=Amycolatopsis vastitatis TaxID=1905142 RepID=A0A229SRT8_9PSEU|nr:hypothetical protein CF165_38560 [Amycolatopsis vastitatis]
MTALPAGPVLLRHVLGRLPLAAGRYGVASYLEPVPFADFERYADLGIVTGIYLITDIDRRVRWLGQASRDDDLVSRLADHWQDPAKRAVFTAVRVLHLRDHTPVAAVNAIEGKCADWLDLRSTMRPARVWPQATDWLTLVA